jgi:hypothetical protein
MTIPRFRLSVLASVLALPQALLCGGFHPPVSYVAGSAPESVVIGNFNGDGKADIVVADGCGDRFCSTTGVVSVLMGRGDGTFGNRRQFVAGPPDSTADYVAAADFNGDGALDLAVVNTKINAFGKVSILLGNGDGSFQPPVSYATGPVPVAVATGDFNGDGSPDVAVANTSTDDVSVLLGNGDGAFQPAVSYPAETSPQGIAVADFNHDHKLDLAIANECGNDPQCRAGTVSVLLGNGDGTFQADSGFLTLAIFPLAVATEDFNGDGNLDLAAANACGTDPRCISTGSISILLGNGDGTFQTAMNFDADFDTVRLTVADLNGDHRPDVAAVNYQTADVSVLLGNGDGTLRPALNLPVGINPLSVAAADLNHDRARDLVVANQISNTVSVFLNGGARGETGK